MFLHLDMGTTGWVWSQYWFTKHTLRGWFFTDSSHRYHNDFQDSFGMARMSLLRHEMALCTSINNAPWKGCAHFGKMQDAAHEFFATKDWTNELFTAMYAFIAWDCSEGALDAAFGSAEHQQSVWEQLKAAPIFARKFVTTKSSRWFQSRRRWKEFRPWASAYLMIICFIGLHLNWWPDL